MRFACYTFYTVFCAVEVTLFGRRQDVCVSADE